MQASFHKRGKPEFPSLNHTAQVYCPSFCLHCMHCLFHSMHHIISLPSGLTAQCPTAQQGQGQPSGAERKQLLRVRFYLPPDQLCQQTCRRSAGLGRRQKSPTERQHLPCDLLGCHPVSLGVLFPFWWGS